MEDDTQISEIDLNAEEKLKNFESEIYMVLNEMKENALQETTKNGIHFAKNEVGGFDLFFEGTELKFATVDDINKIKYHINTIEKYQEFFKDQPIDAPMPEGIPTVEELKNLKEREGDDSEGKDHEEPEEEKEPKEKDEIGEKEPEPEQEEKKEEEDLEDKEKKSDNIPTVLKKLPPNALKLNKHRMADLNKSVR